VEAGLQGGQTDKMEYVYLGLRVLVVLILSVLIILIIKRILDVILDKLAINITRYSSQNIKNHARDKQNKRYCSNNIFRCVPNLISNFKGFNHSAHSKFFAHISSKSYSGANKYILNNPPKVIKEISLNPIPQIHSGNSITEENTIATKRKENLRSSCHRLISAIDLK
jgi:hypothetical protein